MSNISDGTLVSTRIRLARNLEGYPFPSHLKDEKQAKEIIRLVSSGLNRLDDFKLYYMDGITEWEANSLKENHLISPDLMARKRLAAGQPRSAMKASRNAGSCTQLSRADTVPISPPASSSGFIWIMNCHLPARPPAAAGRPSCGSPRSAHTKRRGRPRPRPVRRR